MSFNYGPITATANTLITRFGVSMTMEIETQGTFDRETGEMPLTETTETVTGVLLEAEKKHLGDTLITIGDRKALVKVGGLSTVPKQGYYLVTPDEGRFYINEVRPLAPHGTALLYTLVLKKGGDNESTFGAFGAS